MLLAMVVSGPLLQALLPMWYIATGLTTMLLLRLWQQPQPPGQMEPAGSRKVSAIVLVESQQADRAIAGLL